MNENNADNRNDIRGGRARAKGSLVLNRFQPSADLPSHFFYRRLCLKDLRLVHELEFQTQPQLEHARFKVGACPDQVSRLERLRRILRHDEFGEETQDGVFDALPEREAPSLGQVFGDIDDLLVEIVRPVDDGQRVH